METGFGEGIHTFQSNTQRQRILQTTLTLASVSP